MSKSDKVAAALERLEELLEEKDEKISELESKLEDAERTVEGVRSGWMRHRKWEEKGLPVPRLELHWVRDDYNLIAMTVLVYRHTIDTIEAIPFNRTERGGRNKSFWDDDTHLTTPFRDGVHLFNDAKQLGLRAFITTEAGDVAEMLLDGDRCDRQVVITKKS